MHEGEDVASRSPGRKRKRKRKHKRSNLSSAEAEALFLLLTDPPPTSPALFLGPSEEEICLQRFQQRARKREMAAKARTEKILQRRRDQEAAK